MMEDERACESCSYWEAVGDPSYGYCHRFAPRPVVVEIATIDPDRDPVGTVWPRVEAIDWCGDYAARRLT